MNVSLNFTKDELECRCGCGLYNVDPDFLDTLQKARSLAGFPFVINSGCRCPAHNRLCGGVNGSSHTDGLAVDIKVLASDTRYRLVCSLIDVGFQRIFIYSRWIHVDMDKIKPYPCLGLGNEP